jgi:hypothetical protein
MSINTLESQLHGAVRDLAPRHGFPENAIQARLTVAVWDEYEIQLHTILNNIPYYTIIRLTNHMLQASAVRQAPMITEHIERGIRDLKNHILSQCGIVSQPTHDPAPIGLETPNKNKGNEFRNWLLEQAKDLEAGYNVNLNDIIDKFEELFNEGE